MTAVDDSRGGPVAVLQSERASWVVGLLFAALYIATCARVVQGGDSGELVTVAATGGVAHPSGYPLFGMLGQLFVWLLPFGTAAFKVSALSSLLGAATLGLVHRAVLRATGDGVAALASSTALGLSVLFWRWTVAPEVLSGATFTASLVVLACLGSSLGRSGPRQGLWLGLAFATGVAHHHTAILLAPLLVYGFVAALPRPFSVRTALPVLGTAVAGTLVGLLPYLWLMLPGGGWRWGETTEFSGLVHHFLRADYGTTSVGREGAGLPLWTQPMLYADSILRQLPGLLAMLALAGFFVGLKRPGAADPSTAGDGDDDTRPRRATPAFVVALGLAWFLAGPVFLVMTGLPPEGYERVVVERFHSFPNVLLAVALGFGVHWFRHLGFWSRPAVPVALVALNVLIAGSFAATQAPTHEAAIADEFFKNVLGAVQPDAVVLSQGDSFHFGCVHALEVDGLRPDVACLNADMLVYPWYRRRLAERFPGLITEVEGRGLSNVAFVNANLPHRPVYLSVRIGLLDRELMAALPPAWPAAGALLRIAPPGELPPPPAELERRLAADFAGFSLTSRMRDEAEYEEILETTLWDHYGLTWNTLASGFSYLGDADGAARARARVAALSPWLLNDEERAELEVAPTGEPSAPPSR